MKDDPRGAKNCVIWGGRFPRESVQNRLGRFFEPKVPPWSSGFAFGALLAPFWYHVGASFGVILEAFFEKRVVLPAWELVSKSCYVCLGFHACRRHPRNSSFTCMGTRFSSFRLIFKSVFKYYQISQKKQIRLSLFFPSRAKKLEKERGRKRRSGKKSRTEKTKGKRVEQKKKKRREG